MTARKIIIIIFAKLKRSSIDLTSLVLILIFNAYKIHVLKNYKFLVMK